MPIVPSLQVEFVQLVNAAIAAVSVTPLEVADDGGTRLQFYGLFQPNLPVLVEVMVDGTPYPCYSSDYGRRNSPVPLGENILICATPSLPIGGPYDLRVTQDGNVDTLSGQLLVRARNWSTRVFELRRLLPPWMRRGPIEPDTNLLVQTVVVKYLPKVSAQDGVPFAFTPVVYNPKNGHPAWTSTGTALPGWLSLNITTGELTGTPGPGDVAAETTGHVLSVTVSGTTFVTNAFALEVVA